MEAFDRPIADISYIHMNIPAGYLRISITDHCNMSCQYCHNEGQTRFNSSFLSVEQLRHIVSNAMRYGLVKVRLTGGEPLLHPDCHKMISLLKKDFSIPFVGLNTNGMLIDRLIPMVSEELLDSVVIGLDHADGDISKASPTGVPSRRILENILKLKHLGQDVAIACVYDGNCTRLEKLVDWCIQHDVILKILEVSDNERRTEISDEFTSMIRHIIKHFNMQIGMIATFSEYYGLIGQKPKVYFFHSHCRLRECAICARIHMRVTSEGYIKTCILNDIKYPLLTGDFDENILKAIHNLGHPPEKLPIATRMIEGE